MKYLTPTALSLMLVVTPALSSTGQCPNGQSYALTRTTVDVSGQSLPHYLFDGPLGKGEVQSSVDMDSARQLVCRVDEKARWLADDQRDD